MYCTNQIFLSSYMGGEFSYILYVSHTINKQFISSTFHNTPVEIIKFIVDSQNNP